MQFTDVLTAAWRCNAESVRKFQPRVCFETLGRESEPLSVATLKELRSFCKSSRGDATLSELRLQEIQSMFPGFQSKPWAGISERFQRIKPDNSSAAGNYSLQCYQWFILS